MQEVEKLHREAMELADAADTAERKGDRAGAVRLNRQAFKKEQRAAELITEHADLEPMRSVLHRSAASLALACGEFEDAEVLITRALSKRPPPEIAAELRTLLGDVYLHLHHEGDEPETATARPPREVETSGAILKADAAKKDDEGS